MARLSFTSVSRHRLDGSSETLDFTEGVNILVGEGNTGKTKWIETIDYLLGDEVKAEERKDPENVLFQLFGSASAVLKVNGEELSVERRWNEAGSLNKVYLNGNAINVKDYCRSLMEKLGIPILHFPQGDPYSARTWPELSWRTLIRHIYRREDMWSDIADRQPEVDQHASLSLFLGAAPQLFSTDYGELVTQNKRLWELQAKRDHFLSMLDEVSRDLVGAEELGVTLTPESIAAAQANLKKERDSIEARRSDLLDSIRQGTELQLASQNTSIPDIDSVSQRLVALQGEKEELSGAIRKTKIRAEELATVKQLLEEEVAKLQRAEEAGSVLADLRVTHCPACDRPIEKDESNDSCYVCHRPNESDQSNTRATRRIQFESEQVKSELEETTQLVAELSEELQLQRSRLVEINEDIASLTTTLKPVRQAAAAVLPPELFLLDVGYGRIQEKVQQLERIESVLKQREHIAADIQKVQQDIAEIESTVDSKTSQVDFESLGDRLRDGMGTYFNRIKQLNPNSWVGSAVSVRFAERSFGFKIGGSDWRSKLGGTQKLYFLFAYHYALLNLSRYPDTLYPGFGIIDFPASLEDRAAIADKENFILQPFIELLRDPAMSDCQLLVAGRSFQGLQNVNLLEFTEVWK